MAEQPGARREFWLLPTLLATMADDGVTDASSEILSESSLPSLSSEEPDAEEEDDTQQSQDEGEDYEAEMTKTTGPTVSDHAIISLICRSDSGMILVHSCSQC